MHFSYLCAVNTLMMNNKVSFTLVNGVCTTGDLSPPTTYQPIGGYKGLYSETAPACKNKLASEF